MPSAQCHLALSAACGFLRQSNKRTLSSGMRFKVAIFQPDRILFTASSQEGTRNRKGGGTHNLIGRIALLLFIWRCAEVQARGCRRDDNACPSPVLHPSAEIAHNNACSTCSQGVLPRGVKLEVLWHFKQQCVQLVCEKMRIACPQDKTHSHTKQIGFELQLGNRNFVAQV